MTARRLSSVTALRELAVQRDQAAMDFIIGYPQIMIAISEAAEPAIGLARPIGADTAIIVAVEKGQDQPLAGLRTIQPRIERGAPRPPTPYSPPS